MDKNKTQKDLMRIFPHSCPAVSGKFMVLNLTSLEEIKPS